MKEHINDTYVKQAKSLGYRSRAAFKLIEANEKYHFLKKNIDTLDLGCAPGSWSQVLSNLGNEKVESSHWIFYLWTLLRVLIL